MTDRVDTVTDSNNCSHQNSKKKTNSNNAGAPAGHLNNGPSDGSILSDPLTSSLSLMKQLSRRQSKGTNSESGSSSSGGGNNSDNSALVSLGNHSFGGGNCYIQFGGSESGEDRADNNSEDSDGPAVRANDNINKLLTSTTTQTAGPELDKQSQLDRILSAFNTSCNPNNPMGSQQPYEPSQALQQLLQQNLGLSGMISAEHQAAAANAVANLSSIAVNFAQQRKETSACEQQTGGDSRKRKSTSQSSLRSDNESTGYNTDDDNESTGYDGAGSTTSPVQQQRGSLPGARSPTGKKKKGMDNKKREERNAREKERSFRISKQINELRNLLSSGGVIVPKGTKSSVLTEAANYIRMLQQHQYRSEIDRHQLVQQMQLIGSGAHGPQAAAAIRHVAAQNGVWSLGNFGGVPPKSAMGGAEVVQPQPASTSDPTADFMQPNKIDAPEYRFVFNSCGVGMAIASMGGAFIDCNQLFCLLSNYTKQEVCSLTIFNMTARQDLQQAFDLISQMISPPMDLGGNGPLKSIVLRGAMKNRNDVGLSVSLVKGDDGIAKCFCVTLIRNPASPYDTSKPIPLSFDSVMQQQQQPLVGAPYVQQQQFKEECNSAPAFTSG